jgi:Domain of unknown function (DUF4440)
MASLIFGRKNFADREDIDMSNPDYANDEARIVEIIDSMFAAVSWTEGRSPDFDRFSAAVRDDATIVPAARPAAPTNIASFVKRMSGLHTNRTMKTFVEKAGKTVIKLFGNVAVAIGGFEAVADGSRSRGVNIFLFIREAGDWQIAAMAWDNETPTAPLPEELA